MIENQTELPTKFLERNAPLPVVRAEFRGYVVASAEQAIHGRRVFRQRALMVAASVCIASLSIWRISAVDRKQRPDANRDTTRAAPPTLVQPPSGPEVTPGNQPIPTTNGAAATHQSPPAGMFQGPILSLMGGGAVDPADLEEQLQNRQEILRQFLKMM